MLKSFENIERHGVFLDLNRASDSITIKLKELDRIASDWAAWDDSYRFIKDRNQAYIESNLPDKAVANLDVHFILFIGADGQLSYSKSVDINTFQNTKLPDGLVENLPLSAGLFQFKSLTEGRQAIIMLGGKPLLLAARQIITSNFTGPSRGFIVIGRFIDDVLLKKFSELTHLSINIVSVPERYSAPSQGKIFISSKKTIIGEIAMEGMDGKPAFLIRIDIPRTIYQQGLNSTRTTSIALACCGIVFLAVLLIFGESAIVKRLEEMGEKAEEISRSPENKERMALRGGAEMQMLANSVNRMLDSIENSSRLVRENEEKLRAVLSQSSDAIFMIDPDNHEILDPNPAFFAMTGYTPEDLPGLKLDTIVVESESLSQNIETLLKEGEIRISDRKYVCKGGKIIEVEVSANTISIADRIFFSLVVRDVSERNREHRKIQEMAVTDMLTGIPNRRHLMQRAVQEFERIRRARIKGILSASLGCIMIDLDNFKLINDSGGHLCGDEVLRQCAARLSESVRPYDIIGRYGGEEFVVFLSDTDREQASVVADRIWSSIRNLPISYGEINFTVTASLGVSTLQSGDATLDDLMKRADDMLYAAKRNGRDRIEEG
jgi:diguanylate cyclase (GGDEF)-like protein/PAS domain S-box-containing protein